MNCFEWRSIASSYLDSKLSEKKKIEADAHLRDCQACQIRLEHYLSILNTIAKSYKRELPKYFFENPNLRNIPRMSLHKKKGRWHSTPWYLQAGIEALSIAALVLIVVGLAPIVRTLYSGEIEQKFEGIAQMADLADPIKSDELPLAHSDFTQSDFLESLDEFQSETDAEVEESEEDQGDVFVGKSEIWRFILKTDSPKSLRNHIIEIFGQLSVPKDTPGIGGVLAPGGIQFDLLIPTDRVSDLKNKLQISVGTVLFNPSLDSEDRTFTWYKNKSRKRIPSGQARVVIWLSQI